MLNVKAMNRVHLLSLGHPLFPLSAKLPLPSFSRFPQPPNSSIHHFRLMDSNTHHNQLSFSTSNNHLSTKTCVPCNSKDLQPLTHAAALALIPQVSEWNLVNEGGSMKLSRSWKVKSFNKGLEFFRIIADLAEAEGHHPDLHLVGWNNVTIEIWTHSVGGLTENDFILAANINELNVHGLLRKAKTESSI